MRLALPLIAAAAFGMMVLPAEAGGRPRCDTTSPGFHFKFSLNYGKRDADTQKMFDMMALRKAGVNARDVRRTGDGCLEAWVPNGDGTFSNEYYDPDTMELVFDGLKYN